MEPTFVPNWWTVISGIITSFCVSAGTLLAWKHYQEKNIDDLHDRVDQVDAKFIFYQLKEVCVPQHNSIQEMIKNFGQSMDKFETNLTKQIDKIDERLTNIEKRIMNGK